MKIIISLFSILVFTQFSQAQSLEKATTPKIITKLKVGNSYNSPKKTIKFISVINDSRCPSDVSCVWAGQAKIKIGIYENETLLDTKELIAGAQGFTPNTPKEIMELEGGKKVIGYNLNPYPSSKKQIKPEDYFLELVIE